jgi:hypothetical protein
VAAVAIGASGCVGFGIIPTEERTIPNADPIQFPAQYSESYSNRIFGPCLLSVETVSRDIARQAGYFFDPRFDTSTSSGTLVPPSVDVKLRDYLGNDRIATSTTVVCGNNFERVPRHLREYQAWPNRAVTAANVIPFQQNTDDGLSCYGQVVVYRHDGRPMSEDMVGPRSVPELGRDFRLLAGQALASGRVAAPNGQVYSPFLSCSGPYRTVRTTIKYGDNGVNTLPGGPS